MPQPIFGLPCHDSCEDGTYATVNHVDRKLVCDKCPMNTYSIGNGGRRIDGQMGAFSFTDEMGNAMPLRMEASCKIQESTDGESFKKNELCLPWSATGNSLKAY